MLFAALARSENIVGNVAALGSREPEKLSAVCSPTAPTKREQRTMAPKFSMAKCAKPTKRALDDAPGSAAKVPRAGDVVVDALVPRASSTRAANAPVVVCIYKWTGNAGDALPEYAEKGCVGLYQTGA